MEKTINIGDKEVRLNNNVGWLYIYRSQFGHDIIPTLTPALATGLDLIGGIIEEIGAKSSVTVRDIAKLADSDKLTDALIHLSGLEFVEFINITWALAKCADDTIPEPQRWVKGFDNFPLDEIFPDVMSLVISGLVSSKNLERLQETLPVLRPLTSTQSPSQELSEA